MRGIKHNPPWFSAPIFKIIKPIAGSSVRITNQHDISLPLAVWLLTDEYDYVNEPNYISATSLLKPLKQLILSRRVAKENLEVDLSSMIASRVGHAVHDSIEKAWRTNGAQAMAKLGYPEHVTSRLMVNPSQEQLQASNEIIPIWFEQRSFRTIEIDGTVYKIGGKFDLVLEGRLFDFKTTSVWTYIKRQKDEDYAHQGSIYRWLNRNLITSDHIFIQFLFTDFQRREVNSTSGYPATKSLEHPVPLLSLAETERFIVEKLKLIERYKDAPEIEIPECSDKDLWRGETVYKYYGNPNNTRATKTFDNMPEAQAFMSEKGGKGVIKTIPGEVKACEWCAAFTICQQRKQYFPLGLGE